MKKLLLIIVLLIVLSTYNIVYAQTNDGPEPNNSNYIHYKLQSRTLSDSNIEEYWVYINTESEYDYFTAAFVENNDKVINFSINDSDNTSVTKYLNVYKNDSTTPEAKNTISLYTNTLNVNAAQSMRLSQEEFITALNNKSLIDTTFTYNETEYINTLQILEIGASIMYEDNVIVEKDIIASPIRTYDIYGQVFYEFDFLNSQYEINWIKALSSKGLAVVRQPLGDGHFTTVDVFPWMLKMGYEKKRYIMQFRHPENTILKIQSTVQPVPTDITFEPPDNIHEYDSYIYGNDNSENTPEYNIYKIRKDETIKINSLRGPLKKALQINYETTSTSIGIVEWFTEYMDTGIDFKDRELKVTNQSLKKELTIMTNGYILISEFNGTSLIKIPTKYIEGVDYNISYSTSDYETVEDIINIPPFDDNNDYWQQNPGQGFGDVTTPDINNISQKIISYIDIMIEPIKTLFTGIPEIYTLLIFGFGLSIVMFVLGR